jgi:hypothetical protein
VDLMPSDGSVGALLREVRFVQNSPLRM